MTETNATRAAGSSAPACWTILRWFPCWAHVIYIFMQIASGNYVAAWFAFAAAWFAFMWLAESSNAHALAEERSDDSQQRVVGGKVER